jgi:hypothetical protein
MAGSFSAYRCKLGWFLRVIRGLGLAWYRFMKTTALLLVSASLTVLLATGCGGASFAQSPFGGTPSSDGTNIALANTTDDSNSAIGPTPSAIDGPAPATTDGMTPVTARTWK